MLIRSYISKNGGYMADGTGSSNTAIVAIVVLVIAGIGFAYFLGFFGKEGGSTSSGPTKVIETPVLERKR
jgi:hypothetical protein